MEPDYYIEDDVKIPESVGEQIKQALERYRNLKTSVSELEQKIKDQRKQLRELESRELPDILASAGAGEIRLEDGTRLQMTVKHYAQDRIRVTESGAEWMRRNGGGSLLLSTIEISAQHMDKSIIDELKDIALNDPRVTGAKERITVHPSRLKAFVREMERSGVDVPLGELGLYRVEICEVKRG